MTAKNFYEWDAPRPATLTETEAIVRELAEADPYLCGIDHCRFCTSNAAHHDTCLWLRARKMAGLT